MTCLVKGSVNIDEFYLLPHIVRPGETIASTGFIRKAGGKGANQAYAVGRAGGRVFLDANIGVDGQSIKQGLRDIGVDVSRVHEIDGEFTGRAIIQRASDGENSIVLHAGANFYRPPTPAEPDLEGITHLLIQNEIPLEDTLAYLRAAGAKGITSVYNPSPMPTNEQLIAFPWASLDYLIVNEGELATILSAFDSTPVNTSLSTSDAAKAQLHALHRAEGFSDAITIVCTLGADGVMVLSAGRGQGLIGVSSFPASRLLNPVKDTTGAGDCFAGYFVAMLMEKGNDAPIQDIVEVCLPACSLCVERAGAMESIPSRSEVAARIAQ